MLTLTAPTILQKTIAAYRTQFPMLDFFSTDFNAEPLRLGQTVLAHIRTLPGVAVYDAANGGYANGAIEGRDLLVDVPITIDSHMHVPVKYSHLKLIADQKKSYDGTIADQAWQLGRTMLQSILAKVSAANISEQTIETTANVDLETLEGINSAMNLNGAASGSRVGIVSTAVAQALALDTRIASREYYGLLTGGRSYRVFNNIAGFQAIYEYPDFQVYNSGGVVATTATDLLTKAGHGLAAATKVRFTTTGGLPTGLAAATTYYVINPTTNTFQVSATLGGAAIDITSVGTGVHSVASYELCTGFFTDASAVAVRAGVPEQSHEAAAELGIPATMAMDRITDPESKFSLALMKWMQPGTGDIFVSPTSIWGSSVGKQGGAGGIITDRGGHRLVSA
jgi:hypothetical protein